MYTYIHNKKLLNDCMNDVILSMQMRFCPTLGVKSAKLNLTMRSLDLNTQLSN